MSRTLVDIVTDFHLSNPAEHERLTKLIIEALKRKSIEERRIINEHADEFLTALETKLKENPSPDRIDIHLQDK